MPATKVAMDEAQRLRYDIDNKRKYSDRAEQRTQGCLAQSHSCHLTSFQTVHTSIACERCLYAA
jgi:hypothetical protein